MENIQTFIRSCIALLMRPIADLCIARGIHFQDFVEIAKKTFTESAAQRLTSEGKGQSVSRLSIMTGLQRPDVQRLLNQPTQVESRAFITKVVGQWASGKSFIGRDKKPRSLSVEGAGSEFAALVRSVSSSLSPHTVKFELERLNLIKTEDGIATLLSPAYISVKDPFQTIRFAAEDARDLVTAARENAEEADTIPNLHARTYYDNVPNEKVGEIRNWFLNLGRSVHADARKFLSRFDRDINPKGVRGSGRNRVLLGTFSLVTPDDEGITQK